MKIISTKENLLTGIQTVQKAISNKNTIPILSGILLKAQENKLYLAATDLELAIECKVPVKVIEPGSIVLPAKHFSELVRKLPDTKIIITFIEEINGVKIEYNEAEVNLKGWNSEEFPNIPDLNDEYYFEIETNLFKNMIKQTIFAASLDESRPLFTGALFEIENNILKIVTTDSHRMALRTGKVNNVNKNINIIIPGKTLNEVNRIFKEEEEVIKVKGNNNQICFENLETRIISRLIEGKFPNYKQVIPNEYKTFLKIKTKTFQETIERANLFSNEKDGSSIIKISVKDGLIEVNSKSDIGKVEEKIPVFFEGESLEISFNAKYLLDVLKIMDSEDIDFKLTGSLSPGILNPGNEKFIYIILPLRTV